MSPDVLVNVLGVVFGSGLMVIAYLMRPKPRKIRVRVEERGQPYYRANGEKSFDRW